MFCTSSCDKSKPIHSFARRTAGGWQITLSVPAHLNRQSPSQRRCSSQTKPPTGQSAGEAAAQPAPKGACTARTTKSPRGAFQCNRHRSVRRRWTGLLTNCASPADIHRRVMAGQQRRCYSQARRPAGCQYCGGIRCDSPIHTVQLPAITRIRLPPGVPLVRNLIRLGLACRRRAQLRQPGGVDPGSCASHAAAQAFLNAGCHAGVHPARR